MDVLQDQKWPGFIDWYKVEVDHLVIDHHLWDTFGQYRIYGNTILFENELDAIMFKLRFK
jgi:hypothetical protein